MPHNYLAIDLGASSGRAVIGSFDGSKLSLREVHRFANGPISLPTGLHWDTPRIFDEIKKSLALARRAGATLSGIGIDTWGVDYGLLSPSGELLGPPHHYRDSRTHGMMELAFTRIPRDTVYQRTGIQFMPINTIYQLLADQRAPGSPLAAAKSLLFTPDLLHFWLTGIQRSERSIASTSQLLDTASGTWATDIVEALGLPSRLFPAVAEAGTPLGPLLPEIAEETGITGASVIVPASHDTASAVAAVPASGTDWAYISSGTWSLVGRELKSPLRTAAALAANFTNECGVENTIRFHKNVAGLWLLQECQRGWAEQGRAQTAEELCRIAEDAPPLGSLFDPDEPSLAEYGDMPARIRSLCERSGEPVPADDAALARAILESLALKYRTVIDSLEDLTGPVSTIHIVGGGANNSLLCRFTADACERLVIAGPIEATASGNAMVQALAQCRVGSLAEIRTVIAASSRSTRYEASRNPAWGDAYGRFRRLAHI